MPVEAVHLVSGHDVENTLNFGLREEVACHVEHVTTVAELRLVSYFHTGHGPVNGGAGATAVVYCVRHELLQRLNGVEETCRIGSCNIDASFVHCEFVCLVCQSSVLGHNQTGGSRCRINGHLDAACLFELCGKLLCIACHGFIASRGGDSSELLEVECALVARKVGGVGYEGKHVFSFAE